MRKNGNYISLDTVAYAVQVKSSEYHQSALHCHRELLLFAVEISTLVFVFCHYRQSIVLLVA